MRPDDFRRIALAMTGAVEASHMNHPDFRANGKIFATIAPDNRRGMVKLTPEQQQDFLHSHPAMFESAAGAWGRQGCTMVRFAAADDETVGAAMTLAWRAVMTAAPPRKRPSNAARTARGAENAAPKRRARKAGKRR